MRPGDMQGIAIGIVEEVGKDENAGYVKLRFPWLEASYITEWVSFLQNGAGPNRGVFFMPDEDAEGLTRLAAFVVAPALPLGAASFYVAVALVWLVPDRRIEERFGLTRA